MNPGNKTTMATYFKDVLVKQICKLVREKPPENTVKLRFNWCLRIEN